MQRLQGYIISNTWKKIIFQIITSINQVLYYRNYYKVYHCYIYYLIYCKSNLIRCSSIDAKILNDVERFSADVAPAIVRDSFAAYLPFKLSQ